MSTIIRAGLVQQKWTGDKDSMLDKHEQFARDAKKQGAQVICFQELFYGPYFCQVQDPQYYSYTELIPDGPTTKRMKALAKETGAVQRERKIGAAALFWTIVLGFATGNARTLAGLRRAFEKASGRTVVPSAGRPSRARW